MRGMDKYCLENMVKGWFVGDFKPSAYRTKAVEAALKTYKAGDHEEAHYHKIAVEITAIVSGVAEMNGKRRKAGEIIVIEPGETTDFRAITDVVNMVVKIPAARGDKYHIKEGETR